MSKQCRYEAEIIAICKQERWPPTDEELTEEERWQAREELIIAQIHEDAKRWHERRQKKKHSLSAFEIFCISVVVLALVCVVIVFASVVLSL